MRRLGALLHCWACCSFVLRFVAGLLGAACICTCLAVGPLGLRTRAESPQVPRRRRRDEPIVGLTETSPSEARACRGGAGDWCR